MGRSRYLGAPDVEDVVPQNSTLNAQTVAPEAYATLQGQGSAAHASTRGPVEVVRTYASATPVPTRFPERIPWRGRVFYFADGGGAGVADAGDRITSR